MKTSTHIASLSIIFILAINSALGQSTSKEPAAKKATIVEVSTDQYSFVGKPVLIEGTLEVSSNYRGAYRDAQPTHYAFTLRDDSGSISNSMADVYMKRGEAADNLRQKMLPNKGKVNGLFTIQILTEMHQKDYPTLIAELIDYKLLSEAAPATSNKIPRPQLKMNSLATNASTSLNKEMSSRLSPTESLSRKVSVFIKGGQPIGGTLVDVTPSTISVDTGAGVSVIPLDQVRSYIVFDGAKQKEYFPTTKAINQQATSSSKQTDSRATPLQPPVETGRPAVSNSKTSKSKLVVEYDKFEDVTTIRTPLETVKESNIFRLEENYKLGLSGAFGYEGKPDYPQSDKGFILYFEAWSPKLMILRGANKLSIIADGRRYSFDTEGYEKGGQYEYLAALLAKEEFEAIASANSVQMRIGSLEFTMSNKQLERFRELAQRADNIRRSLKHK